jgi:hypothetical protein
MNEALAQDLKRLESQAFSTPFQSGVREPDSVFLFRRAIHPAAARVWRMTSAAE